MALDPALTEFTTAQQSITTYDYSDIEEGTGVTVFYGTKSEDQSTATWQLTTQTIEPAGLTAAAQRLPTTAGATSFDLTAFNTPKTARGTALLSGWINTSTGAGSVKATIQKVSGVVVSAVSSEIRSYNSNAAGDTQFLIEIPITETVFAAGDILRLKLESVGNNASLHIDATGSFPLRFHMPFKLDF